MTFLRGLLQARRHARVLEGRLARRLAPPHSRFLSSVFFSLFCLPLERSFFKNVAAMRRSVFRAGSSALRLKVQRCPQKDGTRMLISPSSRSSTKAVVAQVAEGGGQSAASDAILTACCFLSVSSPLVCSTDAAACARAAPGAAAFRARCRRRRASGGRAAARRRRRRRQTRSAGRARG